MIFLTGATADYEDVLHWFIDNYNKHISLPLYIADFGLRDTYSNSFKINWKDNAWFYKPRAILEAPAEEICWIDCDIEIHEDISDIFDLTGSSHFGMTKDWCNRNTEWQTGLVCVKNKQALHKWVELCEYRQYRGDQEAFEFIKNRYRITEIPREYNWLRLAEENDNVKCHHWTGPKGKQIIRSKINEMLNGTKSA